jgi:ABC-type antimicrobial peptide transport system permease subunit
MKDDNQTQPPKWPLTILRYFLKKNYIEEIEGDMEELFHENAELMSLKKARRLYTWEMFKLLRPALIRNLEFLRPLKNTGMINNYIKTSSRSLMRNPLNSFINIFGLSVAIGICVFVFAYAQWVYSTDQFHINKENVYLVTFSANRDGTVQEHGRAPRPLGEMLKADFAHVRKVCRIEDRTVVVKYEDNVFHERIRFADPEFLQMLTFPLKWGTSSSLKDLNSVVLSEDMSIKYFGDENPVGRDLLVKFSETKSKAFKITGVAEKFPVAHTIDFGFLINFENLAVAEPGYDLHDWAKFVNGTLVQLDDPKNLPSLLQGMNKYRTMQNAAVEDDWAISKFSFEPLATLHQRAGKIRDDISRSSDNNIKSIVFLVVIAVFMLALACFNYINIGIVTAAKRLKEIGVRKTIGATKNVVVVQFLMENIVVTFFALLVGLLLGYFFFVPGFERMWNFSMGFKMTDPRLWIYLSIVLLLTAIASGSYPAFYISRFEVVSILKGSLRFGKKNPITKIFLCIQLVLTCVFITSAVTFTQNTNYMSDRSWGYDQRDALYISLSDVAAFEKLEPLVQQNPNVLSTSGSSHHLGKKHASTVVHIGNRQGEIQELDVDANYFKTMGIKLISGRTFKENSAGDRKTIVVNETFTKNLGIQNPIGNIVRIDSAQVEIIGIVKDFHSYSFFTEVQPIIFSVAKKENLHYLSMKVRRGTERETYRAVQSMWASLYPETPFDGGFQEDVWGSYYEQIRIHAIVWEVFATLAVIMASLGLYGLVTLNVVSRVREFSIRKILGAGLQNIADSIGRQYIILLGIALIIAAPGSYFLMRFLFDLAYAYHMPVTYSVALIAILIMIIVFLGTVSTQIRRVLNQNPVNGLKAE